MEKMAYFFSLKASKVGRLIRIQNWLPLAIILFVAAFMRLYRISDYMTFLGDEGRDVLVAKGILEGQLTLLGPRASAGDFFLGPVYYYLIAPFLWIFRLDPVGPAVMVALFGIATAFLVYKVAEEFFGFKAALMASSLYAVSPLVIAYSRSSWNPNLMPFVSLLTLYVLYKGVQKYSRKIFIAAGILLGIALQLHYLATFLILISFAFVFFSFRFKKEEVSQLLKKYLDLSFGIVIGWFPFLIFEIRHNFPNLKTIINFIFQASSQNYLTYASPFEVIKDVFFRIFARLLLNFPPPEQIKLFLPQNLLIWQAAAVVIGLLSFVFLVKVKNKFALILLSSWGILGILLFAFYKKAIYDYYFGFMFPLPFLLVGNFLSELQKPKSKALKLLAFLIFASLLGVNLYGMPFRFEPNRQKDQVKTISEFVLSKTDNKPFNFALITPGNSDYAYRYYFEILGKSAVPIDNLKDDPQRKSVTSQLLIVCEENPCHPLGYPSFEVSNFGRAEIVGEWNISVVKVYRLVHYKGE